MKRILCGTLVLMMLCTSAVAFADANGDYALSDIQEKGPARLVDEPITLTVFCGSDVKTTIIDGIEDNLMTRWMEACTGVHIEWITPSGGDASTALNLSLASGDYPDIYWGVNLSTAQVLTYASQGILLPLNDYLEEYAPAFNAFLQEDENARNVCTAPDGNIYSFARTDGGLHVLTWRKMFVYKPWLEAYLNASGKEEITTTEDFKDMLVYFRDNDMNGNGDATDEIPLLGEYACMLGYLMEPFQNQPYFHSLDIKDGTVFAPFVTEGWKEGLAYMANLYSEGLIAYDSFVMDGTQRRHLVSQPDKMVVGCVPNAGAWFMDAAAWGDRNVYEDWTTIAPLEGPSGLRQAPNTDFSCKANTYITTACEYPEVAVAWNDYWYTEEGMLMNYMGFEGINYEWVDEVNYNGTTPAVRYLGDSATASTITTWWNASAHRRQTPELRYSQVEDMRAAEYSNKNDSIKYLEYIVDETIPQVIWMNEEQANEITMIESIIKPYIDEMTTKFIVGDMNLESDWEAYIAALDDMQLARWIELYQEIMDMQV